MQRLTPLIPIRQHQPFHSRPVSGRRCADGGELRYKALLGRDGHGRFSEWPHGTFSSFPPLVEPASGPGSGLDRLAGKSGSHRSGPWRHRLTGVRDASFGWLAAIAGPGRLAGEASSLAVANWQ